ncbi:MAG: hypothetical protein GXY76_06085 [Chloroflexi bacterium]|nr:hypothetical protein [Chloroflexota bacterium]
MAHRTIHPRIAYDSPKDMLYGLAKYPVVAGHHVAIGGGLVLPEVKFTLPAMLINSETMPQVRAEFQDMVTRILKKSVDLHQESLVVELELLPDLTMHPEWGALVTSDLRALLDAFHRDHGLRTALRVTVTDIRDLDRPPALRSGEPWQTMLESFRLNAEAGADILSIESTGGKEVFDHAILAADIDGIALALGALAPRDMEFLWGHIVDVAESHRIVAGGDTACAFGNTAMQLAHQNMVPKVVAAVVRLMTAPRSLVAVEMGARGPLKDCGYENPIIKAVTGVPISMEGKTSACAHSSPLGNIAAAVADLWSNESVQNVRLLSGFAPEVFTEMLIYDARLMNTAQKQGRGPLFRDLLVDSDRYLDPQALVLSLEVVHEAARRIVEAGPDHYARTKSMAELAVEVLSSARHDKLLELSAPEQRWLDRLTQAVAALPDSEAELVERVQPSYGHLYLPQEYGDVATIPVPSLVA